MEGVLQAVVFFAILVFALFLVFFGRPSPPKVTKSLGEEVVKAKSSPREPADDEDQNIDNNNHDDDPTPDSPPSIDPTPEPETPHPIPNEEENDRQQEPEGSPLVPQASGGTVTRRKIDRATLLKARSTVSASDTSQVPKLIERIKSGSSTTKPSSSRPGSGDYSKFSRVRTQSLPDNAPLDTSSNRWTPTRSGLLQPLEQSMKQAKGVLNKLTPENFESLGAKVSALDLCDGLLPAEFSQLLLETAIIYPLQGATYAQLAVVLTKEWANDQNPESDFRCQLLTKCQSFFVERSVANDSQHRKRVVNAVRFIGALFCNRVIPPTIVTMCIQELLDCSKETLEEQEIEALCTLVTAVGQKLDSDGNQSFMDTCAFEMNQLCSQSLPSRLRFLILDTLDLRLHSWRPRRKIDAPQKLEDLRKEMERAVYHSSLRTTQRQSSDASLPRQRARTSSGVDDFLSPATNFRRGDSLGKGSKPRSPNTPEIASPSSSPVFTQLPRSAPTHPSPAPSSPLPVLQLPAQSASAVTRFVELPPSVVSVTPLNSTLELQSSFSNGKTRMSMEDDSPTLIPIISPCITPPSSPTRQTPKERIQNLLRMFFLTQSHQHVISEMTSDTALRNSIGNFIGKGVSMSFDLNNSDRVRFVELIQNLLTSGLATSTTVTQALQAATADLEDLVLDVPHSPKLAAFYLSQCFLDGIISAQDLVGIFQTIQKHSGGIAEQVSTQVIASIKEQKGLVGVQELLQQLEQSAAQTTN